VLKARVFDTTTGLRFLFRVTLRRLDLLPEMYFVPDFLGLGSRRWCR
jgi:hypothetical protein